MPTTTPVLLLRELWIYLGLAWLFLFANWKVSMFGGGAQGH